MRFSQRVQEERVHSVTQVAPVSRRTLWIGRIFTAVPAALVLFGAVMKLLKSPAVVDGMMKYGIPEHLVIAIGVIELLCTIIYLIPSTAVLGAILMTGLLGGATFTNVRVNDSSYIITVALGVLAWAGLFLRDQRLRELIPFRR
jgi:uncharacterized membrane protein (UPF0182 family)